MAEITQAQIDQAIVDSATKPQSWSMDGTSQTNRSLSDIIALDNHVQKKATLKGLGLRFGRMCGTGGRL